MKHLFTFNERLKGWLVNLVNLVMQFFKLTKLTKLTEQIFATYATYATYASANFVGKESNESTEIYRVKSRITTTCLRLASVFTSTRIRLASLICLCMLTVGVGNAWGAATTLPTSFDSGKGDLPTGYSHSGLGSNYDNSPKLKFDSENDYLLIQFSDSPDKLGYKIKRNGTGTSVFTVEESSDGSTFTTVKTYNSAPSNGTVTTESNIQLKAATRYVRFYYTTKGTSTNIAIGAISISKLTSVATPTFSVSEGTYTSVQSVTISCATDGATIYYTTDGTTPTSSSTVYSSAISISSSCTLKAIAKKGSDYSSVASASYTINIPYTVSFSTGTGNPSVSPVTEEAQGDGVELPAGPTPACSGDGWSFAGWSTASCSSSSKAPILYLPGDSYYPESDETLYAVYRKLTSGTSTASFTASDISNLTAHPVYSLDWLHTASGAELYISSGQRYTGSPNAWNVNAGTSNFAIVDAHRKISSVTITVTDGTKYKFGSVTPDAGTATLTTSSNTQTVSCTGDVTQVVLYAGSSYQVRATDITITYYNSTFNSNPSCCEKLGSIDGAVSLTQGGTSVTVKDWGAVTNAGKYTVKCYEYNEGTSTWGLKATQENITNRSTGATFSSLTLNAKYKFSVQAIATNAAYCDGDETAVTSINSTSVTSTPFQLRYAIHIDDGTNSDSGWEDYWLDNDGEAEITLSGPRDYYEFKIKGGWTGWWGQGSPQSRIPASTEWTLNGANNVWLQTWIGGTYTFTVDLSGTNPKVTITFPPANQAAGKIVYWDASIHGNNWTKLIFRVGTDANSNAGSDCKVSGQLVPGTDQFYKVTTAAFNDMRAWAIANNAGWTGSQTNGVYRTNDFGDYNVTKSSVYQDYVVGNDGVTLIPASVGTIGDKSYNNNCYFYSVTKYDGMLTHTATISATSHGSINIAYTDVSGTAQDKIATTAGLAHRTILTVSSTPASGYSRSTLTVNGDAHTSGNTHILAADATIAATFSANNYTITLNNHSATTAGTANIAVTFDATTNLTGTPAITVPTKIGYTFGGYYTGEDGAGSQIIAANGNVNASVASYTSSTKQWIYAGDITLHAKWTINSHTLTWNWGGGSCSGTAGTHYTAGGSLNYGTDISYPDGSYMSKAGYTFSGWSTDATTMPDNDLTITAQWTAKEDTYKTALHTGESGWTTYASGVTKSGAGYSIPAPSSVDKGATSSCEDLHYAFAGWVADEYKASPDGHIITASGTTDATGTTYWAVWGDGVPSTTYSRLTSIAGVDESAQYVLGIDGTGFHYSGTSNWGLTALPANQTPLYYTLTKEDAVTPTYFTAETSVSSTTYYLQVAGTGAFNMTTSSGTDAGKLVIGSTTNYGGSDKAYAVSVKGGTDKSLRRNGASGIRCYNNTTTGSLVFFYKVVPSGDIDYVTSCCELKPATGVTVASTTGTTATLSWTAPSPTTGISKLQVRDASDNSVLVDNLLVSATGATVTGLTECDEYTFYVASVGATCYTASESVDAQPYSGAKTVTYKYHDDVTPDGSFTTDCDNTSTTLPNPTRTGYTLNGWYTEAEGGTKKGNGGASYTPDADITLHAQWSENNYTVTMAQSPSVGATLTGGTTTAHYGGTINISTDVPAGYRFTGWTADPSVTFADASATSTTFSMPASNVTITANFVQIHTLTFTVPTDGGSAVTPPATADHGGTVTLPDVTGISSEYSCETFIGWTTTAPVSGTWASTPSYKAAGATSDAINAATTFYAVYRRPGVGPSGSIELTCSNVVSWRTDTLGGENNPYGTTTYFTTTHSGTKYRWQTDGQIVDAGEIQLKDNYAIKIPTVPGRIDSIFLKFSQGNETDACAAYPGNATTRAVYFNSSASTTSPIATSNTDDSRDRKIKVTGDYYTGYILNSTQTSNVHSVRVKYGAAPIISHTLKCECPIEQFDLTYDANTTKFPGSTTSCEGVTNYAWAAHSDVYTICSTKPTLAGYKFIGWNTDDNGDGDMYDAGQVIKCVPTADVTLYAQYERVYTVTFNNQGATTAVTQDSYGAEIAVPSATTPCSSDWAFVGWSETAIAPMSMIPSIEIASGTSTYTPTKDVTLYAIYRKTSESSAFVAGMSGAYKIKATYNATDYYAGTANTALAEETNAANAVAYYIKYTSADGGKYTIQRADAKYITTAEDGTNLSYGDSEHYWTITKVGDLWSVQSIATSRYLRYRNGTGFKAYTTSQDANYVSFVATDGQYYYRTMSCASDYDITFHANGSTITWASGYPEASYKDLTDATVVSTFPTASFSGWTFLGWRRSDYDESTTAPESATIFGGSDGTGGNSLTIASVDEDLYPVFTRFEDNEPFDQINGGDYFIYFLESGSDDGYGDERRVYAAAYGDSKRYNSSALCSSATEFTFTKLANGNWTIYDKTTNKYLYAEGNDWLKQKTGTSGAEWTLTVNGSAFDAYCVGTDFGQISAFGDGASATFQNYARTNISGGSPNPLYHRVYLGGCTNRTFTTQPSNTPEIEIHGQAKVTSTATKSVKARTVLTVSASNISTANLAVTSNNSAFKFSLSSNGTYTASVNIPVVSNKVAVTPVYLEYTPAAGSTSDGIEGAIVTVSDGAGTPTSVSTVAGDVQGHHLPANFVIAAKLDDRWYALPANCTTSTSSTAGILIEVDDVNDPTTATLAPDYTKYGLREVASGRYAANGANVTFVEKLTTDPAKEYTLYNGSTTSVQVNAQWSGYSASNPEKYEWILSSDDFEDYTLTSATTLAGDANPRTVSLNTSGVWGTLLNSKSYDGKVRLLPATFYEESLVQIVEWKASAIVVMYTGTETSATTKVGTGDASSSQTLSTRKLTHGVYELSTDAFASNEGKILWLYFGDTKKAFEIPWIITGTTNAETGHDKHDVVITKTGKLSAVSTKYSFRNVYVYGGGKLKIASGTSLGVNNIIMRAGGITTSGIGSSPSATYEYIYPQVELGGTLTSTQANIKYEYITDYDHWYQFCLPFNASLNSITYPQEYYGDNVAAANTGSWVIKRYAGEVRATGSYDAWKDIETEEATSVTAGHGYIFWGAPKKVSVGGAAKQRQQWGIQRITMPIAAGAATTAETNDKNISVDSYSDVEGKSTKPNDQGWNLVGNPYMVNLTALSSESMIAGELVHTETVPWDGKWRNNGDGVRYVTIPDNHFDSYVAKTTSVAAGAGDFMPGRAFFVQIAEGASTLTFAADNRASLMPARAALTAQSVDIETGILMSDESKHDEVNFWIKDGKTAEYEYNADYPKTPNSSNFNIYGVHSHGDLSWIAISPEIAEGSMAIGYQVPTAGEYRLSLSETYVSDKIEQLLVTDHEMSPEITTDLMEGSYEFMVNQAETNKTRFTVSIQLKEEAQTPTDIDNVRGDPDKPTKFIYHDKMYILRGGQLYDATGKQVREINK